MHEIGEIRGCVSEADARWVQEECSRLLGKEEHVDCALLLQGDIVVFTAWRLLVVQKHRLRGKEVEYTSIPYRALTRVTIEAVGTLDLDAELRLWTGDSAEALVLQFTRQVNVYDFQAKLARRIVEASVAVS